MVKDFYEGKPQMQEHSRHRAASAWVARFADAVPRGGVVLDVACGTGRNARLFLERGYPVTALDRYNAGVVDLLGRPDFAFIDANLELGRPFPTGEETFGCVVVTNYLHRPILPAIVAAVADGGILLYETFAEGNARFGPPQNPDFLLRPGELLDAVAGKLEVIAYEHGEVAQPRPAMMQRICALRPAGPGYSAARRLDGGV